MTQRAINAWVLAASLGAAGVAGAQDASGSTERALEKGRVELSTAASFASTRSEGESESANVLNVPLRVGWFVSRQAEIEGELLLSHFSSGGDSSTGVIGSGRVLYHFGGGARTVPFVFAGGGVGNAAELLNLALDVDRTVSHWEVGAGIKTFVGSRAAFRLEYRFARFSAQGARDFVFDSGGTHADTHRVFAGISLFFR